MTERREIYGSACLYRENIWGRAPNGIASKLRELGHQGGARDVTATDREEVVLVGGDRPSACVGAGSKGTTIFLLQREESLP